MVLQYTSTAVDPPVTLLRGVDSYENDELIENMLPEDVWFHVDSLSSAHVYLRLKEGQTIDDIPKQLLEDACQLVKANSIQGCKLAEVKVVYTMWSNLKKLPGMKPGEVSFLNPSSVKKVNVKKEKTIVNRLQKTEKTIVIDYESARAERERREIEKKKAARKINLENKKEEERRNREAAELKSYSSLMKTENMTANTDYSGYDSDSFM
ncbi:coiled-coil domain-containing protein 25 isoform 1 [Acyrthosiphon pisum]|uniref:Coiled-coil domain-containing protein 25 n=2 Tax=Acyrthosiphon pisum TaxID=7029 RepID=A0A8R1XHS0_ACYPI|nr:coiled-coil domain-containing protein 25 isoform 1 [Acyrthosiphon pisum]|eukprot:NP_001191921.1 coiled-coil domain-containing protein 25 isoform 1 [Acyrthosiphon pisum]